MPVFNFIINKIFLFPDAATLQKNFKIKKKWTIKKKNQLKNVIKIKLNWIKFYIELNHKIHIFKSKKLQLIN